MGRIRTKFIKNLAKELTIKYPDKFSNDFESNKKNLDELKLLEDKPIRNKVAGYIVTIHQKKKI